MKAYFDKLGLDPHGLKSGSRAAAKWKSENLFYQSGAVSTDDIAPALATAVIPDGRRLAPQVMREQQQERPRENHPAQKGKAKQA